MSSEQQPRGGLSQHLLAAAQEESWVVQIQDGERTLTTRQIVDAYNERLIDPETYVWRDGMQAWQQLQAVDALVDALHAEAEQPAPAPAATAPANGAARNESSALFSLAMLMSDQASAEPTATTTEDSGLIDLAALQAAQPVAEPMPEPLFQAGLFQDAPVVAQAPPVVTVPPKSPRGLVAILGGAVVCLAAALVFVVVRAQGETAATPQPTAANAAAATPSVAIASPAPEPTPRPAPEANEPEAPAAPGSSEPSAPPREPKLAVRPRSTAKPPVAPPPKATAKPSAKTGGCKCDTSDLQCQMRCAVKR